MFLKPFENRLRWRARAPVSPGEVRRTERWLATARVFLTITALVAIWMDSASLGYPFWTFVLLGVYITHGLVIMVLLRVRQQSTRSFRLLVHAADVGWPALISLVGAGPNNPFFLFFVFVLAAAAYRWGLLETVATAITGVALLWVDSLLVNLGWIRTVDAFLMSHHLPLIRTNVAEFEPRRLFMRSIYLLVMSFLLGYLADQQKQLRGEKAVIARILGRARVEAGLAGTLHGILTDLMEMFGSGYALIASQEANSHHVFTGEVRLQSGGQTTFRWLENSSQDRPVYLFESPADVWFVQGNEADGIGEAAVAALDKEGNRVSRLPEKFMQAFGQKHPFRDAIVVSFLFGREWWGRFFLLDPRSAGNPEEELHFLQELVKQAGPAVYNVYLLRRLRLRAGAAERARFARELHDGAVQSLIAVEMQVDVIRRQSQTRPEMVTGELSRIQGLLREEVLKLRELMQQMKSMDLDAKRLLGFLGDTVERFQRETGITARFSSDMQAVEMPQPVCREIARIVQEALVNVRKHSKATQVHVRLGSHNRAWQVEIEDNGCGFPFEGYKSQTQLDADGKGPTVIQERVRLLEGQLAIESKPGQGARLEISVPWKQEAIYG